MNEEGIYIYKYLYILLKCTPPYLKVSTLCTSVLAKRLRFCAWLTTRRRRRSSDRPRPHLLLQSSQTLPGPPQWWQRAALCCGSVSTNFASSTFRCVINSRWSKTWLFSFLFCFLVTKNKPWSQSQGPEPSRSLQSSSSPVSKAAISNARCAMKGRTSFLFSLRFFFFF